MQGSKELLEELKNNNYEMERWVCDYQINYDGGLLRNVKPQRVKIQSSYELDQLNEKFKSGEITEIQFNSGFYLIKKFTINPYGKKGKILSKEISLYGTQRGDQGIHWFNTEQEAIDKYNQLVYNGILSLKERKASAIAEYDTKIKYTQDFLIGTDFVMETLVNNGQKNEG